MLLVIGQVVAQAVALTARAEEATELVYDDGRWEFCWYKKEAGLGGYMAVQFSPPYHASRIISVKYYIARSPAKFDVLILDSDRNLVLEKPASTKKTGWFTVDLSEEKIGVKGEFYVAMRWTVPESPCLGADETRPDARSFFVDDDMWRTYREVNLDANEKDKDGDFMIRAKVEATPVTLALGDVVVTPGLGEHIYVGDLVTATFTVENAGIVTASDVEVRVVDAPPEITDIQATAGHDLSPGESGTWQVSMRPSAGGRFDIFFSFFADGTKQVFDFGDESKITLYVELKPAFLILKRAVAQPSSDEPLYVGDTVTITYVLENAGQLPASDVEIRVVSSPQEIEIAEVTAAKDLQPGTNDEWQMKLKAREPGVYDVYVSFYVDGEKVIFEAEGQPLTIEQFKTTVRAAERPLLTAEEPPLTTYALVAVAVIVIALIAAFALSRRGRAAAPPPPTPPPAVTPPAPPEPREKFCVNCGSSMPMINRFCPKCGTQQA